MGYAAIKFGMLQAGTQYVVGFYNCLQSCTSSFYLQLLDSHFWTVQATPTSLFWILEIDT
jgi:hypothetical protein